MSRIEQFRRQVEGAFQNNKGSKKNTFKSITAMILFGAIILVFVLFGVGSRLSGAGAGGSAARVNKTMIPISDLSSEVARLEQMYAPLFGGSGMGDAQRQFLRQQALESLISQELIYQGARREGVLATDTEIQDILVKEIPAFQREGRFNRDLYFAVLQANHLNPSDFEEKIRKEKAIQRTRQLFEVTARPLDLEVQKIQTLREHQLNVSFVRLDKDVITKNIKVSEAQAQAKLADAEFMKRVEADYKANKAEYSIPEEVHAQHILIKIDAKTSETDALNKINELKKRAEKEDFAKLAKENSQDEGSKAQNGDLGFFGKGRMVPEFDAAAFSQTVGVVGAPVKTQFGYHLIKVLEKHQAQDKTLDQVKLSIAQKNIASDLFEEDIKQLDTALSQKNKEQVEALLKKLNANWDETGFFDLSVDVVPKLGSQQASSEAFRLTAAEPYSSHIVRDGAQKFVLKWKADKKDTAFQPDGQIASLSKERMSELFGSWVEQLKKTAQIDRNNQLLAK